MSEKIKPKVISETTTLKQLSQDCILITHSPQLANDWKRRYNIEHNMAACATPKICTWSAWLAELFQQTCTHICLQNVQEQLLWQKSIQYDMPKLTSYSVRGLAKQASHAYTLMQSYQISIHTLTKAGSDEAEALARWIQYLHKQLQPTTQPTYILKADIANLLLTQQQASQLLLPSTIILDGFEQFTPIQEKHLAMYEASGSDLMRVGRDHKPSTITLHPCQDELHEYQHIALQSRNILAENPHARIAIVSAHSTTQAEVAALNRCMQKYLAPESCLHPDIQKQIIPRQQSLADTVMIQQALHMLTQSAQTELAFEDFSALLFCPWIRGFEQERMQRAALDVTFRQQNRHRIQLKGLLKSKYLQTLPSLNKCIEHMVTWQQNMPKKQSAEHWIKACQHLLQRTGFMQADLENERVRSAFEVQCMNSLHEVLSQLIALDTMQQVYTWSEFLAWLRTSCAETQSLETTAYNNINILSIQEAIGMQFDYLLMYGMDDNNFPPSARPQSLLPMRIQQDYHIPMSHGSLLFESCQWLWQQIQHVAPHMMVSYAISRDEQYMQASNFVSALTIKPALSESTMPETWALENFDDSQCTPVKDTQHIRGGTGIIKHQSACPFRAFAVHRLRIDILGETTPGIEASSKGSLIHLALEYIWQHLLTQQKLLNMNHEQRIQLIDDSIKHAWQQHKKPIDFHSQAIEKKRMANLLQRWLEVEAKRPPFQIESLEKAYQISLPSHTKLTLPINITLDRIDKDMAGHRILIDYKTGSKQSSSQWLGERIAEPQLPMYALAANLSANDAVSFASVRSGDDMGFEGLSGDDMGIKGLTLCDGKRNRPDDWQGILNHWQHQIDALAEEFIQGHNDVAPRDKQACDYCQLEAVCRIDELKGEV